MGSSLSWVELRLAQEIETVLVAAEAARLPQRAPGLEDDAILGVIESRSSS